MSAQDQTMNGHGDTHDGHHHEEEVGPHATLGGYLTGFVLSVFLTLNVVRGDAESGLLQPPVVRPVGRAQLLLARFVGAAGVAAADVLAVYAATIAITHWAGGWTPDRLVSPGIELAAAVVVVSALALAGSVFFAPIANGIGTLMVFGAGLIAGLLGEIGHAIHSQKLEHIDLTYFVTAKNLLNEDIRLSTSLLKDIAPLPGRNVTFGVRAKF